MRCIKLKIRWGHFSDLHFQFQNYNTSDLRNKLLEKIAFIAQNNKLNYLFITGDIFNKGDTSKEKKKEMIQYIRELAERAGCDYQNILICAGNHDLKRCKARATNLNCVIEDYEENGSLDFNGYSPIIVDEICAPFVETCTQINRRSDIQKLHYCIETDKINIYVLNTAIFAGQTYPGQKNANSNLEDTNLYICDDSLIKLGQIISSQSQDSKLNIILAHHGTECFAEKEEQAFIHWIRDKKIDLYLCGHVHKNIFKTLDGARKAKQISCGGLFVDKYNSPSFIIGEYDSDTHNITISNYEYISSTHGWRAANSLDLPFNEHGKANWTPDRWAHDNTSLKTMPVKVTPPGYISLSESLDSIEYYRGITKVSLGFDRDKEFIEIRERAKESVTILGVGMSKLSKYALTGPHSLEELSRRIPIHLIMFDPEYLEKNSGMSKSLDDFFGINEFHEDIRKAFNRLKKFCNDHNNNLNGRKRITLSVYTSIPVMSAVMIDEKTLHGELVVEYFGYHCGQNRPLFAIKNNVSSQEEGLFTNISKQIIDLLNSATEVTKKQLIL